MYDCKVFEISLAGHWSLGLWMSRRAAGVEILAHDELWFDDVWIWVVSGCSSDWIVFLEYSSMWSLEGTIEENALVPFLGPPWTAAVRRNFDEKMIARC